VITNPTVPPAPVLSYDPLTRASTAWRVWRQIIFLLILGFLGGIGGLLFAPGDFRATVLVSIPMATPNAPTQQAAIQAMVSPSAVAGGVSSAQINGVTLTPAQVLKVLRVRAIRGSRLIEVSATNSEPGVAAGIAAGVTRSYVAANPAARIVGGPSIPARQELRPLIILAGLVSGLAIGWAILALRRR
jgi:hypothetical protein